MRRLALALAAMMPLLAYGECYPSYTDAVLRATHPTEDPGTAWMLSDNGACVSLAWHGSGAVPAPAEIVNAAPGVLRPLCQARLRDALGAQIDARRAAYWPGQDASEVAESIAAAEPSPEIVAAYLADRAALKSAAQIGIAAAASLSADAAYQCSQTGEMPQ